MEFINLSHKPLKLGNAKKGLSKLITLPDYCPGRGCLPVGIIVVYDKKDHKISSDYLGPDIGCGMTLAKFRTPIKHLEDLTNKVGLILLDQNGDLGSLGGGNHFVDIYQAEEIEPELGINKGDFLTLIHTGSRHRGQEVYERCLEGEEYLGEYEDLTRFGEANRRAILGHVEKAYGEKLDLVLDNAHNTLEVQDDKVIYRKGAVKLNPGEISIIPSSMNGEAVLVRGKESISEIENSMCHGTGRKISRSKAREERFFLKEMDPKVYIPYFISPENIATEFPQCYNTIEDILPSIKDYVDVIGKFSPKSAIML